MADDALAHQGRNCRDGGEDHHREGHDPGHVAPLEEVADHGDRDGARRGGADALHEAGAISKVSSVGAKIAGERRQRIKRRSPA
jgi:hypothetical protein